MLGPEDTEEEDEVYYVDQDGEVHHDGCEGQDGETITVDK
jgi:hypothetical protein